VLNVKLTKYTCIQKKFQLHKYTLILRSLIEGMLSLTSSSVISSVPVPVAGTTSLKKITNK